jgi:Short repeat of unknown function (DUF308)
VNVPCRKFIGVGGIVHRLVSSCSEEISRGDAEEGECIMVSNTQAAVRGPASHWWVVLIEGIFALILGIVLLPNPVATSVFLATVLGIYLLIRGVLALLTS